MTHNHEYCWEMRLRLASFHYVSELPLIIKSITSTSHIYLFQLYSTLLLCPMSSSKQNSADDQAKKTKDSSIPEAIRANKSNGGSVVINGVEMNNDDHDQDEKANGESSNGMCSVSFGPGPDGRLCINANGGKVTLNIGGGIVYT